MGLANSYLRLIEAQNNFEWLDNVCKNMGIFPDIVQKCSYNKGIGKLVVNIRVQKKFKSRDQVQIQKYGLMDIKLHKTTNFVRVMNLDIGKLPKLQV